MATIFSTEVTKLGSEVQKSYDKKMIVFFGSSAPANISDFCVTIKTGLIEGSIVPGCKFKFGDNEYEITAVGAEAQKTLKNIGHCALKFTGSDTPDLPGSIHVEDKALPTLNVGDKIEIIE